MMHLLTLLVWLPPSLNLKKISSCLESHNQLFLELRSSLRGLVISAMWGENVPNLFTIPNSPQYYLIWHFQDGRCFSRDQLEFLSDPRIWFDVLKKAVFKVIPASSSLFNTAMPWVGHHAPLDYCRTLAHHSSGRVFLLYPEGYNSLLKQFWSTRNTKKKLGKTVLAKRCYECHEELNMLSKW